MPATAIQLLEDDLMADQLDQLSRLIGNFETMVDELRRQQERTADSMHEIALEQAAARYQRDKQTDAMADIKADLEVLSKAVQPILDWQRTGIRALAWLVAAGGVAAWLFSSVAAPTVDMLWKMFSRKIS